MVHNPPPPKLPVDFGVCLLALDYFEQLGLPCVSAAEVLRCRGGVDVTDPDAVEDACLELVCQTLRHLVAGTVLYDLRAKGLA
ncbi:MAG TPA: hypothetical protein VMJ65_14560 [Solirubrobacteraceae bacterium]|nr:hypothetical protein [Solirubrobacteraceae bacterium]